MNRLRRFRSRKLFRDCSLDQQARRRRLLENAYIDLLSQSSAVPSTAQNSFADVAIGPSSSSSSSSFIYCSNGTGHDSNRVIDQDSVATADAESTSRVLNDRDSICSLEKVENFEDKLRTVFAEENMTHKQIKAVLRVIKSHSCFASIHIDPRTIMNTPIHPAPIIQVAGGEYLHLGVRNAIKKILLSTRLHEHPSSGILEIDFSTDEASLDKASRILMWPIQIRVANIPRSSPHIVGVFKGSTKPSSALDFFKPFVEEMQDLLQSGIELFDKKISIALRCFIADAPARAFSLGHRSHNSRAPCSRCWVRGKCIRSGVMIYEGTNHRLRTREEYFSKADSDHHSCIEFPFGRLDFNLLSNTIFDYMHLVCLGIMEKILQGIIDGRFVKSAQISSKSYLQELNRRLEVVKSHCPRDFARKPVNIEKHGKFKATEQRQLLLYTGPVIFNGLVNAAVYAHFLLLHTAIRILTDPEHTSESVDFAEKCIILFNQTASDVYGLEFLSYNVHALLHLPDDVRSFGPLDSYSAFPYENNMSYFRKLCRKPSQHLQQIANRNAENCHTASNSSVDSSATIKFIGRHAQGPAPPINDSTNNYSEYNKVVTGAIHLSKYQQDSAVILKNGSIAVIMNVIETNNSCHLLVKKFEKIDDLFNLPCRSSILHIYLCSSPSPDLFFIPLDEVVAKCFLMPYWSANEVTCTSRECSDPQFVVAKILSTQLAN